MQKHEYNIFLGGQHKICMTYVIKAGADRLDTVRFSIRMNVGEEELRKDDAVKTDFISQIYSESINLKEKTKRYIKTQEHNRGNEDSLYEVIILSSKKIKKLYSSSLNSNSNSNFKY